MARSASLAAVFCLIVGTVSAQQSVFSLDGKWEVTPYIAEILLAPGVHIRPGAIPDYELKAFDFSVRGGIVTGTITTGRDTVTVTGVIANYEFTLHSKDDQMLVSGHIGDGDAILRGTYTHVAPDESRMMTTGWSAKRPTSGHYSN